MTGADVSVAPAVGDVVILIGEVVTGIGVTIPTGMTAKGVGGKSGFNGAKVGIVGDVVRGDKGSTSGMTCGVVVGGTGRVRKGTVSVREGARVDTSGSVDIGECVGGTDVPNVSLIDGTSVGATIVAFVAALEGVDVGRVVRIIIGATMTVSKGVPDEFPDPITGEVTGTTVSSPLPTGAIVTDMAVGTGVVGDNVLMIRI